MVRLFLIVMFCAALAATVVILASSWTTLTSSGDRALRAREQETKDQDMATSGIQKAAFIALIVVLFGVASGWLGGL